MTSNTFNFWHLTMTATVTHVMCAQQAAQTKKVYCCGRCIEGDDGP